MTAGAVPLLVLCVQEPELALKRVAASALSDIAKHTPELAQVRKQQFLGCPARLDLGGSCGICFAAGSNFLAEITSEAFIIGSIHIIANMLRGICRAQSVVDAGAVAYLAPLVVNQDAKLKRQVRGSSGGSC
jgi:hypothetical protein